MADFTVTLKTNRWYLQIFFWVYDSILHCMFIIVKAIAEQGGRSDWKKYTKKGGRKLFQEDLALELMQAGIEMEWKEPFSESEKPAWMRHSYHIPYGCERCFLPLGFLLAGSESSTHLDRHTGFR